MHLVTLSEQEIIYTMLALSLLLIGAYSMGKLFEFFKAPKVVGEIIGGMIFGGSFLHHFYPQFVENIFMAYPEQGKVLNIFYQLGLIFLMFSSGFNTNIDIDKKNIKTLSLVFSGATFIPMLLGIFFIKPFEQYFIGTANSSVAYGIVFVISIAITSIPVISKIFFDIGIMNTKFANTVLTVSTFQDLCLWILLNSAINIVTTGELRISHFIIVSVLTIGIFIFAKWLSDKLAGIKVRIKSTDFFALSFILLFVTITVMSYLSINIMYSAFIVGYIIKSISEGDEKIKDKMEALNNFSFALFVPIYFALVGIQINVIHDFSLLRFLIFFVMAFTLEAFGTVVVLLFSNLNKGTILNFAITMNARGGPGIVLATVAYSYQIISIEFFTVLILTTMLSSLIAGYWLRNQQKRKEDIFMNLTK